MNRFKFSITNFKELKGNSAICAFISLSHFVTSEKKYLDEQIVKKKVIVFASKIKKTQNHYHQKQKSITASSKEDRNKDRNIHNQKTQSIICLGAAAGQSTQAHNISGSFFGFGRLFWFVLGMFWWFGLVFFKLFFLVFFVSEAQSL